MKRSTLPVALEVVKLSKTFDGIVALDSFDLEVNPGEIVALIGPNGAGKSTLFNIVTGFLRADSGSVFVRGKNVTNFPPHRMDEVGIARTFQNLRLISGISALANVQLSFPRQNGEHLIRGLTLKPRRVSLEERENREKALELLEDVGLKGKAFDLAGNLSYGQQKLLTLACVLAMGADILLLDEPVAGVAPQLIDIILGKIRALSQAGKTIVLIEHNIYAVEKVADRVVFMDAGRKVAEGTPSEVLTNPQVLEAYLE